MDGHNTKAEGARREGEQAAGGASLRGDSGGDGGGQALPQDSGPSDGGEHALLSVAAQTRGQPQVSPRRTSRLQQDISSVGTCDLLLSLKTVQS